MRCGLTQCFLNARILSHVISMEINFRASFAWAVRQHCPLFHYFQVRLAAASPDCRHSPLPMSIWKNEGNQAKFKHCSRPSTSINTDDCSSRSPFFAGTHRMDLGSLEMLCGACTIGLVRPDSQYFRNAETACG